MTGPLRDVAIRFSGKRGRGEVEVQWAPSSRKIVPEVEQIIEAQWARGLARLGSKLFDGPMCRLECVDARSTLRLWVSRTSYKPFLGTNLNHVELADRYGPQVLANPVGLSAALETSDGWLLLGKRNDSVASYPNRVHPFAGSLEPREQIDVFAEVLRELREELEIGQTDVESMICLGLAEDLKLRQPELIFQVGCSRSRAELEAQLDAREHSSVHAIAAKRESVKQALADEQLTPIARATLAMWAGM